MKTTHLVALLLITTITQIQAKEPIGHPELTPSSPKAQQKQQTTALLSNTTTTLDPVAPPEEISYLFKVCPAGCMTCPNNEICTSCSLGYFNLNYTCIKCDPNCLSSVNCKDTTGCTVCKPGYHLTKVKARGSVCIKGSGSASENPGRKLEGLALILFIMTLLLIPLVVIGIILACLCFFTKEGQQLDYYPPQQTTK